MTMINMGVSKNRGTPKSSILIGFSIINHPFWGTPIFGKTHIFLYNLSNGIPENWSFERERSSSEHPFFRGKLAVSFGRVVPGGSLPAVSTGAHNSTYRGEITPVAHIVSAMYRGYFTPFITTSWWLNQPI